MPYKKVSRINPIQCYLSITSAMEINQFPGAGYFGVTLFRFVLFKRGDTKPYKGKIVGGTFNISRIINYRNSFLSIHQKTPTPVFNYYFNWRRLLRFLSFIYLYYHTYNCATILHISLKSDGISRFKAGGSHPLIAQSSLQLIGISAT